MNHIVIHGLKIITGCRYIKFTLGNQIQIKDDPEKSVFEIIFPKDTESSDIIDNQIELILKTKLIQRTVCRVSPLFSMGHPACTNKCFINNLNRITLSWKNAPPKR